MKLRISHKLSYTYSEAVSLEPHSSYLYPKTYPHQQVLSYVREGVTTYAEQYTRQTAALARWITVPFLTTLCQNIYQKFVYERRDAGAPLAPEHTLIGRKGSCRDFAQLFVAYYPRIRHISRESTLDAKCPSDRRRKPVNMICLRPFCRHHLVFFGGYPVVFLKHFIEFDGLRIPY